MLYKITFFKNDILPEEWEKFFTTIFNVSSSLKFTILFQTPKIDFYIESEKKLDVLNSRLFPFCFSDEISPKEKELLALKANSHGFLPKLINKNLVEFVEDEKINERHLAKIEFKVTKHNPFKTLPVLNIVYDKNEKHINRKGTCLSHLYIFLSFELSKSINSEITKVKPVLAANKASLELSDEGVMEMKNTPAGKLFSTNSYDFDRHSLIIGQSGSGKSVLAKLLIEDIAKKFGNEYAVVLVDPHGALDQTIKYSGKRTTINFKDVKTNLFINIGQPTLSTELTIDLFSTVLNIKENQNLMRVLKYSLNSLFGINKMSLVNLKNLLTDSLFRKEILKEVTDANNLKFFETEYQSLYNAQYATAILPILNLVSELDSINSAPNTVDLVEQVDNNFLVSISIKQSELGTNVTRIVGGAIIQQVFTMMMAGLVKKKVILAIDELSIVQTPSLIHILSEARKFGLTIVIIQQYLMQVSAEILKSVFANIVNYFCFKLARDDAEIVVRNLNMEIDEYFLKNKNDPREIQELGTKILTDLNPQEVVCRAMANSQYCSPFKSKTVNVKM